MAASIWQQAESIERVARKLGYSINHRSTASTGSTYLYLSLGEYDVEVRISDHGEVYLPKKPTRRIDVNPETGVGVRAAIQMLRDPASIELVQERELTPEEQEWTRQYFRAIRQERENFRRHWQELRATLRPEHWRRWRELGGGRPGARQLAAEIGCEKPGVLYAALTNGRKW